MSTNPTPNPKQTEYIIGPDGTGIPWKPFQYLYFHIKQSDQKLYDAFDRMAEYIRLLISVKDIDEGGGTVVSGTWVEEVPSGAVDDVNVTFGLSHIPILGSLTLFLNIQQMEGVNFTITGSTITMTVAPKVRDITPTEGPYWLARYQKA